MVSEYDQPFAKFPDTQPASWGGPSQPPPRPPKVTARDLLDPGDSAGTIFVADRVEIKQLAGLLGLKPFKIVADVLELGVFKHADELIDFSTAEAVAQKHGVVAQKL